MRQKKQRLSLRLDESLLNEVYDYQKNNGIETTTEAIATLIKKGLTVTQDDIQFDIQGDIQDCVKVDWYDFQDFRCEMRNEINALKEQLNSLKPDTQTDIQGDIQPDTQTDTQTDIQGDIQPDTQTDTQGDIQGDSQSSDNDTQPVILSDIQSEKWVITAIGDNGKIHYQTKNRPVSKKDSKNILYFPSKKDAIAAIPKIKKSKTQLEKINPDTLNATKFE